MNILSKADLKILLGKETGANVSVSIYVPTQKATINVRQNRIKLKNLLTDAEERLVEHGLRRPDAKKLLSQAARLPDDDLFWQHQSEGLAVFISGEVFQAYHVPLDFKESVVVADRFQIKPLLPIFSGNGSFYILALSQHKIRLLQCSHYSAREIDLAGIAPASLAEVIGHLGTQRQESHHMGAPGVGRGGSVVHGQDLGDEAKNHILRFFQEVNRGVHHQILKDETAPLILAGVDYLHPIYKTANTYPHLFEKGIDGNPEGLSSEELHKRAWGIMQPFFDTAHLEAVAEYTRLAGSGHTSNDIREIVSNAYAGGIDLLFVALGIEKWGTFDADSKTVDLHEKAQPYDDDLLDFAAAHTIMHRGTVYAVKPEDVPGGQSVAAVFRHERHHPLTSQHKAL